MKASVFAQTIVLLTILQSVKSNKHNFFAPDRNECNYVLMIKDFINGLYDGSGIDDQDVMRDCRFQAGAFLAQLYDVYKHANEQPDTKALFEYLLKELPSLASRAYLSLIDCHRNYDESEQFRKYLIKFFNAPNFERFLIYKLGRTSSETYNDGILFKQLLSEGNYYESGKIVGNLINRFVISNLRK